MTSQRSNRLVVCPAGQVADVGKSLAGSPGALVAMQIKRDNLRAGPAGDACGRLQLCADVAVDWSAAATRRTPPFRVLTTS